MNKEYNEALCSLVRKGELAIWFNVKASMEKYREFTELAQHIFPECKKELSGYWEYLKADNPNDKCWNCWREVKIPSRPVSDFILKKEDWEEPHSTLLPSNPSTVEAKIKATRIGNSIIVFTDGNFTHDDLVYGVTKGGEHKVFLYDKKIDYTTYFDGRLYPVINQFPQQTKNSIAGQKQQEDIYDAVRHYNEHKNLLRELVMRAQIFFPENEQDLKWFEEQFKGQNDLFLKLSHLLGLGVEENSQSKS